MNNICYALLGHQFSVQVSNLIFRRFFLRFYLTHIKLLKHMPQHETLCYALGRMRFYIPWRKQPLEASKCFIWISKGVRCYPFQLWRALTDTWRAECLQGVLYKCSLVALSVLLLFTM